MSSIAKPLYELIISCISSQQRLQPYKLTQKQAAEVFLWLDQRRRGFVDVSDLYTKFPQLAESELFYVFKFLDIQRKGAFTYENLASIVIDKKLSNDDKIDSVKSFNNFIKILRATFHSIEQQKRRLGITPLYLQKLFRQATLRKQQIELQDLLELFKESKCEINKKIINYLDRKIFNNLTLNINQFIQIFSQINFDEDQSQSKNYEKKLNQAQIPTTYLKNKTMEKVKNSEEISNDIEKILLKYKKQEQNIGNINYSSQKQKDIEQIEAASNLSQQMGRKPQNFRKDYSNQSIGFRVQTKINPHLLLDDKYLKMRTNPQYQNKFSFEESNLIPSQSSKEVNQRRQQLRRGSLERQKIIDEIVNKKRMFNANAFNHVYSNKNSSLKLQNKNEQVENEAFKRYNNFVSYQASSTPIASNLKPFYQTSNLQTNTNYGAFQDNLFYKSGQFSRPASVSKSSNYRQSGRIVSYQRNLKPQLTQFYRKGVQTPKSNNYEKQNILKRAQEEATKKIQQIQRRARLKVMEKRSAAGVYNRWLK